MLFKQYLTTRNFTKVNHIRNIKYIVIHYTANDGDTDEGNSSYFHGTYRGASAHYFIDEDSSTQVVLDNDISWHCGDTQKYTNGGAQYKSICTNLNSIGIEMCSDKNNGVYYISDKTVANTITVVKALMKKYGIDSAHVIRHYDVTGKICPQPFVANVNLWNYFKSKLIKGDDTITTKVSTYAKESWNKAIAKKVLDGTSPQGNVTREQLAVILDRLKMLD